MPRMKATMVAIAAIALSVVAAQAGTFFRIEVGPPVAAGFEKVKEMKKPDGKLVFVVRPRLCDNVANVMMTGSAEGLINGERRSVRLTLIPIDSAEGVYGVLKQWKNGGHWVVQLNGTCSNPKASASTLVPMNDGTFIREKIEVLGEPATKKQVDAALAAIARSQS